MGRRTPSSRPRATAHEDGERPRRAPRRTRLGARILRAVLALFVLGSVLAIGGAATVVWYYDRGLPSVDTLRSYRPPQTTRVVDRHGETLGELFTERRTVVPLARVPRVLVLSVLAAEDADFYQHEGMDYLGLLRALYRGLVSGGNVRGTSTITQQIVKLLLLSPERSIERKLRELILARRLEATLTKDEILELYLNHINFGHGRYGVEEASRYYFGKGVDTLTLSEASLLAGIPQAPTRLSPRTHWDAALARRRFVLRQLEDKRSTHWPDLARAAIEDAREHPPRLAPVGAETHDAPEIVAFARELLRERVGPEAFARGGFVLETSIDRDLQRAAREALRTGLRALDARHGYVLRRPSKAPRATTGQERTLATLVAGRTYRGVVTRADRETATVLLDVGGHAVRVRVPADDRHNPSHAPVDELVVPNMLVPVTLPQGGDDEEPVPGHLALGPEGALILLEPRERRVVALVGGYRAEEGFNRALRALRQPGSAFKPIVYALGLESRRFSAASVVLDAPVVYERWQPQNYEAWTYEGPVSLRVALARSINSVAIRVIEEVSPAETVGFARRLGIESPLEESLALALGASEVTPIELTNAFATFAAAGRWEPWRIVTRIVGPDGRVVGLPPEPEPRAPISAAAAFVLTSMLQSVVAEGTGSLAAELGRPAAGKTGTSNDARDAWFVGYTPELVGGVWIGFDDNRSLGRRESGGRAAVPIWVEAMEHALRGRPATNFPMPPGVVTARVDPASGLLVTDERPNARDELFLDGTAPTELAPPADAVDSSSFMMEQFGSATPPPPEPAP